MPSNEKILLLVRHAHRDTTHRELDNGLSKKGKKQTVILTHTFQRIYSDCDPQFLSSPKRRCIETLQPIANIFEKEVKIDSLLLEKKDNEREREFQKRIQDFLKKWVEGKSRTTIICSHGDWLPIAVDVLTGAKAEIEKGGWAEVALEKGQPILKFRNS